MKSNYLLYHLIVLQTFIQVVNSAECTSDLEPVFKSHNKNQIPSPGTINVTVEIHISEIIQINQETSDFDLDLYYSELWQDPSLNFEQLSSCSPNYTFKPDLIQGRIWTPKLNFINSKQFEIQRSPYENGFINLYKSGNIWANYRLKIKAPCVFDWKLFPFDSQTCTLNIESAFYDADQVQLMWHQIPVTFMKPVQLTEFTFNTVATVRSRIVYPIGLWDDIQVIFTFTRSYWYYLLLVFFPSVLMVVLSWVGFFLGAHSVPVRICLSLVSLVGFIFPFAMMLKNSPKISQLTCLDVWIIACLTFIVLALIATAAACHYALRRRSTRTLLDFVKPDPNLDTSVTSLKHVPGYGPSGLRAAKSVDFQESRLMLSDVKPNVTSYEVTRSPSNSKLPHASVAVDNISMILFPFAFIVFNVLYWCAYFVTFW